MIPPATTRSASTSSGRWSNEEKTKKDRYRNWFHRLPPPHRPTRLAPRRPARQKTGGGRRRGFGSDWGRICRARAARSQDTTPAAARATLSSESTRSSAGREAHGPTSPGARSQPNKLARTAMFVLTRSRCSQSAGKVPTCEAACQRRWACTSRGDLLCHQRPGPDRRPDRRQNGVRARRCAAAVWRAALCEGKLGG